MARVKKKAEPAENSEFIDFNADEEEAASSLIEDKPDDFIASEEDNVIKKIIPAKWEAFLEILDFLTKDSDESVIIKDSVIMYPYKGGSIIKANLTEVFDDGSMNLHISSPKKWTKLFKTLKDGNVYILDEDSKFIVTNGQIKLFLPKQLSSYVSTLSFPNLTETENICESIIQKESRDKIHRLGKDVQYIEFLLQDGKFKSVNVPNTAIFILPEYVKDPGAQKLTSSNADLTLRSTVFLPYPADTYRLLIGRNLVKDSYFAYTICKTSLAKIELYESLDNSSGIAQLF